MTFLQLTNGAAVESFVTNTPITPEFLTELQAQLAAVLGANTYNVPVACAMATEASTSWAWKMGTAGTLLDPPYWESTAEGYLLMVPLPAVKDGRVITKVSVVMQGDTSASASDEGYIKLMHHKIAASGTLTCVADTAAFSSATPWRTAGAWALVTASGLTVTLDGESEYFLLLRQATEPARNLKVLGVFIEMKDGPATA